jgi:hypothetical protein
MEAAIPRVLVFLATGGTRREGGHRRPLAVIGQGPDNRVARTTLRAVQERIGVPPIPGITHLGETCRTNCQIRSGKQRRIALTRGRVNPERLGIMMRRAPGDGDAPKTGGGRRRGLQLVQESIDGISIALGVDQDAVLPVPHRAAEPVGFSEPIDEWTEADSLNDPFDQDAAARSISRLPEYG